METINKFMVLFFVLALWPESSEAQDQKNAISIDVFLPLMSPISSLSGEEDNFLPLNVKYQRVVADHLALMFKAGFNYNWKEKNSRRSLDFYPMVGLDWRPFRTGLKGFYTGLSGIFGYTAYYNTTEGDDYRIALGPTLGYQFVLRSRIVIDLTFGLGYGYYSDVDAYGVKTSGYSVDETIGGVFVGYCF
jgi:hypothetical protein